MNKLIYTLVILLCASMCVIAQEDTSKLVKKENETSAIDSTPEDNTYIVEKYEVYIKRLNLFVSISYGVLGLFVVINLFNGNKHIKESKNELKEFKNEISNYKETIKQLEGQKDEIINSINEYGKKIFKDYLIHYKIKAAKEDLEILLSDSTSDIKRIFEKLSIILEHPDNHSLELYSKSMERYPTDANIRRLCLRGIRIYGQKNTKPNNM